MAIWNRNQKLKEAEEKIALLEEGARQHAVEEDEHIQEIQAAAMQRRLNQRKKTRILENIFPFGNIDAGDPKFDDKFFAQLGSTGVVDLPQETIRKSQRLSMILYRKNVRAFSSIELVKDFVWGEGVQITANDNRVKDVLDEHWEVNEWEEKGPERLRALALFGEQLWPTRVNDVTGLVHISSVIPIRIRSILRKRDDAEILDKVLTNIGSTKDKNIKDKTFDIIKLNDDGKLEGEAFYFAINRVLGSTRGLGDLVVSIDWFEGQDNFIFSLLERAQISQDVVHDLTYEGLDGKELRKKADDFNAQLNAGGIFVHNEKVKHKLTVPEMGASEGKEVNSILLKQINSGTRLAGLFYGDSDDLTRASASELSVPVAKYIQGRQNFLKRMLARMFRYQIEQSIQHGKLNGVNDFGFKIEMSKVFLRDMTTITKSMVDLSGTLEVALDRSWVNNDEASDIYRSIAGQITPLGERQPVTEGEQAAGTEVVESYNKYGENGENGNRY